MADAAAKRALEEVRAAAKRMTVHKGSYWQARLPEILKLGSNLALLDKAHKVRQLHNLLGPDVPYSTACRWFKVLKSPELQVWEPKGWGPRWRPACESS